MKKKMYLLFCLCLAMALLAGCVAVGAASTKEESNRDEISNEVSVVEGESIAPEKESTESAEDALKSEVSVPETPSYEWDFQKGWPIYVGECVDTFEDRCWPYGDGEWYNTTSALSAAGEKLLYHIRPLISHCDEYTSKLCSLLDSLEIPYETTVTEFGNKGIHFNLSRRDSVQLAGYMLENGLTDDCLNLFTFCNCGDLCGATNTASPKIPDDWETLAWKYED